MQIVAHAVAYGHDKQLFLVFVLDSMRIQCMFLCDPMRHQGYEPPGRFFFDPMVLESTYSRFELTTYRARNPAALGLHTPVSAGRFGSLVSLRTVAIRSLCSRIGHASPSVAGGRDTRQRTPELEFFLLHRRKKNRMPVPR
jgi:hypothetical protein